MTPATLKFMLHKTKYLLMLWPRQQQMGILLIMMMRSDKWAVVTAAKLSEYRRPLTSHLIEASEANHRAGSESSDQ